MTAKRFLILIVLTFLALPVATIAAQTSALPTPDTTTPLVPRLEGVEHAQQRIFTNGREVLDEPDSIDVIAYEFVSVDEASAAFPDLCDHIDKQVNRFNGYVGSEEVSIGRLGDEACAYIDKRDGQDVSIAIRIGDKVLTVFAIDLELEGDTLTFVGDWLDGYVATLPEDAESLMPELADMPRGWSILVEWEDITDEVTPQE